MGLCSMIKPLRVGLTGGIGSGKSTVANMFSKLGVPVIDADVIAHEIVQPGQPALQAIVKEMGADVLDKDGNLNREYMRKLTFHDSDYRQKLESILHPLIYEIIEKEYNKILYDYCIIVVPLLIETGAVNKFDRLLIVDAEEELQLQRASKRDLEHKEQILKIIQIQASRKDRHELADDIITNNGNIDCLLIQVDQLHQLYLNIASKQIVSTEQVT
jgi:dephospho-CoA kinase